MANAEYCGQCINIEWNNKEKWSSVDRYWCKARSKYVEPTEKKCSYDFIENKSNNDNGYTPSGCYITTIIVDILGYEDNCELLNVLRNFRDTILKTNIDYLPLLLQYDQIGPVISERIKNRKDNYTLALGLAQRFLVPCAALVKSENYDEAIQVYTNMVMHLSEEFELPVMVIDTNVSYDLETLGKGRLRQPKTSEI